MKDLSLAFIFGIAYLLGITHGRTISAAPAGPGMAPTVGISVKGDVAKSGLWTLAKIQKLAPAQTISATLKGEPYTVKGIPLRVLVEASAPRFDQKTKHAEARYIVLASGKDGYTIAFSWLDLMAEAGDQKAFIIWEANGKPLGRKDGPLQLLVPGDKKPMRWVYNLTSLRIYDGKEYDQ